MTEDHLSQCPNVQVLEYNTNLVATVVLSDPEGQDWGNSKPYNDGETVSAAVQFWWYHMQVRKEEERALIMA